MFLILIGPVKLKYIAAVIVLLDIIFLHYGNVGGIVSHAGGAIFGFLVIRQRQAGKDWTKWLENIFDSIGAFFSGLNSRPKPRVVYRRSPPKSGVSQKKRAKVKAAVSKVDQDKIDEILDKISQSGYDSLTDEEKQILFKASNE